jgi:toxin YoeB
VRLIFSQKAWTDYLFLLETDPAALTRINSLIKETLRTPFIGIGKPEPLRGNYKGYWSRRITLEHRFVYRVSGQGELQSLEIASCRFHYG